MAASPTPHWHAQHHLPTTCPQVRDTLGAIQARFTALKVDGGAVHISRLAPGPSRRAMRIKSVVMYSAAWVKQQARMASTSNQETFRADVEGRVVLDVLRQVGGGAQEWLRVKLCCCCCWDAAAENSRKAM